MSKLHIIHTSTTTDTIKENSGSLANTFDAEAMQKELDVQVRVTQQFSTVAPTLVADYAINQATKLREEGNEEEASKWDEGGAYRVGLHTIVGGLSGDVSGALGAGASALAIPAIGDIINHADIPDTLKAPLIELAGTAIGGVAGSIGGDGMAGAYTGNAQTVNNYLSYHQKAQRNRQLKTCNGDPECIKPIVEYWDKIDEEQWFLVFLGGEIGTAVVGGAEALPDMWDNTPWYALGPLIHASIPLALPAVDIGGTYIYMNPDKVLWGYGAVEVANDIFNESMPPSTPVGSAWNIGKGIYDNREVIEDTILNSFNVENNSSRK